MASHTIKLSALFTNPAVKAAFERAERDNGTELVVPAPRDPNLIGSSGASMRWRDRLEYAAMAAPAGY
ncbi:hypothetical protein [Pararhizobium sp. O133]|uniref:hypothetical protein n=1 Tax=Pararhizobium sp. O133 TaxID=3449278 RepID=UPI003F6860D8